MNILGPVRRRYTIPLTSLVDVVFILLFFFMLASSFQDWRQIDLNLAGSGEAVTAASDQVWLLRQDPEQGLWLDGEAIVLEQLEQRLQANPAVQLIVQPSAGISLQQTIALMDRLRASGVRLSLGREAAP